MIHKLAPKTHSRSQIEQINLSQFVDDWAETANEKLDQPYWENFTVQEFLR